MYKRFKALLKEKRITLKVLIEKLDLPESSMYAWKRGTVPNLNNLIKIADYFNVSIDYLIGRSNHCEIPENRKPASLLKLELIHKIESSDYSDERVKVLLNFINEIEHFDEEEREDSNGDIL